MWNAIDYFETLKGKLKLTKTEYTFCRVTGLNYLEEILSNIKASSYLGVDDTDDGATIQMGGGWVNRRSVVVYVLKKYKFGDNKDRQEKMNEIRVVHKKLLAKLIKDSGNIDDLMFLDKSRFPYHEVPGMFAAGTCGMWFVVTLNEPTELICDANDYDE